MSLVKEAGRSIAYKSVEAVHDSKDKLKISLVKTLAFIRREPRVVHVSRTERQSK